MNGELYKELLSKNILTDQHSSITKLQNEYEFQFFFGYVHIIGSFGSHSAIFILVREDLFMKFEIDFEENLLRFNKKQFLF